MRFINLKNENKKLKVRKAAIAKSIEEIQENEKETLAKLKNEMFEKNKQASLLQGKIDACQSKNNDLEAEFESEITRHNDDQKEAGQII
jgi:hypothetical protein